MSAFARLQREIHQMSKDHGFWADEQDDSYRKLVLIHSEISEAVEELRSGRAPVLRYYQQDGKPEGFGVELADAMIRIMDLAERHGIDLDVFIAEKMSYNAGRPVLHGKTA